MADYVTLMGSEDVSRAGYAMRDAAAEMSRAAGNIDSTFHAQRQFLDDWLQRLESVMSPAPRTGPCQLCKVGAEFSKSLPAYHVTEYWEGHERAHVLCGEATKP